MSAVAGLALASFVYGYVSYIWSHSPWLATSIVFAILIFRWSDERLEERCAAASLGTALWVGGGLAYLMARALRSPAFVPRMALVTTWQAASKRKALDGDGGDGRLTLVTDARAIVFVAGFIYAPVALSFLTRQGDDDDDDRPDIPSAIFGIGIALIAVSIVSALLALGSLLISTDRHDRTAGRYLIYYALYLLVPSAYALLREADGSPLVLAGFVVVMLLVLLASIIVGIEVTRAAASAPVATTTSVQTLEMGQGSSGGSGGNELRSRHARNEAFNRALYDSVWRWAVLVTAPLIFIYFLGFVMHYLTHDACDVTLALLLTGALVGAVAFCVIKIDYRHQRAAPETGIVSVEHYATSGDTSSSTTAQNGGVSRAYAAERALSSSTTSAAAQSSYGVTLPTRRIT